MTDREKIREALAESLAELGCTASNAHRGTDAAQAEIARLRGVVEVARHHLGRIQNEARYLPLSAGRINIEYSAQQALARLDQGEG